ncbi:MAG: VWA-like domain-containing protein [Azoarcus sp.]|jgi:predicted metal-dependent peptidase|nr:VWA-like domain-containing protein [Azoarcus sp.]
MRQTKAEKALSHALVRLSRNDVFFSSLAFYLDPRFLDAPWCSTACTDGARIQINPAFFAALGAKEQVALLKHEVMHVAFEHVFRRGARHPLRWNIACDCVINLMILEEGGALPPGGFCNKAYKGLIEEEVYEKLPPGIEERLGGKFLADLQEGDDLAEKIFSPAQRARNRQRARALILQAAQAARMTQGSLPLGVERYLEKILEPEQDWRALLAEYLTALEKSDYDWMRPNRRNGVLETFLPGMATAGALEHIAIVVDTSGSIGKKELARFIGEILGVVEVCFPRAVTIIPCDAKVYPPLSFDCVPARDTVLQGLQSRDALKGGGGTDMPAALDWIDRGIVRQEFFTPPAVALVMTDGYTDFGPERDYPVIWCITANKAQVPAPGWGRVVRMEVGDSF